MLKNICQKKYYNHLKIFTDGSVLENKNAGAAFVIPAFKIEKQYYLGKYFSIFSAELVAVKMALNYLLDQPINFIQVVICVDSQSVLSAIQSSQNKIRPNLIFEIKHHIHCLTLRGSVIQFCWVPSHCGIYGNEWVDRAAKQSAKNNSNCINLNIPLSVEENYSLLVTCIWKKW